MSARANSAPLPRRGKGKPAYPLPVPCYERLVLGSRPTLYLALALDSLFPGGQFVREDEAHWTASSREPRYFPHLVRRDSGLQSVSVASVIRCVRAADYVYPEAHLIPPSRSSFGLSRGDGTPLRIRWRCCSFDKFRTNGSRRRMIRSCPSSISTPPSIGSPRSSGRPCHSSQDSYSHPPPGSPPPFAAASRPPRYARSHADSPRPGARRVCSSASRPQAPSAPL